MKKILIIDNEQISRNAFHGILEAAGFSAVEASTGKEGLNILKKEDISAVILDIELCDTHGVDVLRELKRIDFDVPVVMVSANGDASTVREVKKHGAYEFFAKPPNFDELVRSLRRIIEEVDVKKYATVQEVSDYPYFPEATPLFPPEVPLSGE